MVRHKKLWGVVALVALAFAAGRLWVPAPLTEPALAAPSQDEEMPKEMQAYMDAARIGKHHQHLERLAGRWEGEFTMWMNPDLPPMQMPGTIERQWVLDGHYLKETVESRTPEGTFLGLGYIGFNNLEGRYEFVWMENMSTAITFGTGSHNPKTGIFTSWFNQRDPVTGHVTFNRSELDMSSQDRHVYTGYTTGADGSEYKSFVGVVHKVD